MTWYPSYKSNVPKPTKIVTWADGTDEEIAAMLEAHYAGVIDIHDYWTVGDKRTVTLNAMEATGVGESHAQQNVEFALSNSGGKYLSDGITVCAFQVDQFDCLNEKGYMNSTATNVGGWKNSARRTWCNSVYRNALPATFKGIFKEFINQSGLGGGSTSGVENTTDYFALRAEKEVNNTTSSSVSGEGNRVSLYATASNIEKKINGVKTGCYYFRSPHPSYSTVFAAIGSSNHNVTGFNADENYGLAPFGVI